MDVNADDDSPVRVRSLVTWRLSRLNRRAHRILTGRLTAAGFSGYQYRLLAALAETGPMSQVELGQRAGLDRSDVTHEIETLSKRSLVERSPDPTDRRRNVVALTEAGAASLEPLDEIVENVQNDLLAGLSENDRREFDRLLDLLLEPTSTA